MSLKALGSGAGATSYYTTDPNREADHAQARDEYYAGDGGGRWWSSGSSVVRHNAPIEAESFSDLAQGYHPGNGEAMVQRAGAGHRAGWDLTFSAPKSVSVLWAGGNHEQRQMIEGMQTRAVEDALQFVKEEQLLTARAGKNGVTKMNPTDMIVGRFDHFSNRAGDPQLHTHSVVMNISRCEDGKFRTLEPQKLFDYQKVVGTVYRASLSSQLHEAGFKTIEAGRDQFEIGGIDQNVIDEFSRRSSQIENELANDGLTRETANQRQLEQASLKTRSSKSKIPSARDLDQDWKDRLADLKSERLWDRAQEFKLDRQAGQHQEEFPTRPAVDGNDSVSRGASKLFEHENVISRKELLEAAFIDASASGSSVKSVYENLNRHLTDRSLLQIGIDKSGDQVFTTSRIANDEAVLLRSVNRPNERNWFSRESIDTAISENPMLSGEQQDLVRFAGASDGVAILEAAAGTGKTTAAKSVVRAAQLDGLNVVGLAPSYVAADELGKKTGISTTSIAKWRHDIERAEQPNTVSEFPALNNDTVVIVDEAGMVSTSDLSFIAEKAKTAGAKLILQGDTKQLESVGGGAALRATREELGRVATLSEIRRQKIGWQRESSQVMAQGDPAAGLKAYIDRGHVTFANGPEPALNQAVASWSEQRAKFGQSSMITRTNADAEQLNELARQALRAEGELTGGDVAVKVRSGKDNKVVEKKVAVGDEIRFRENIKNLKIRNHSRARVERIDRAGMTIRLEDGRRIAGKYSDFTTPPTAGGKVSAPRLPKFEHGYAGTVHSEQGRTVSATTLYLPGSTDARLTYVGLTRHEHDARVIVDSSRLDDRCRRQLTDPRQFVTQPHRLGELLRLASRATEKRNVADYASDRVEFIRKGGGALIPPASTIAPARSLNAGLMTRASQRLAVASRRLPQQAVNFGRAASRAIGAVGQTVTNAVGLGAPNLFQQLLKAAQAEKKKQPQRSTLDHMEW